MLHLSVVIIVFMLMSVSLLLNTLGIYCLRQQKGGNKNQRMLLVGLSAIEIIKVAFDYIALPLYNYNTSWYLLHYTYFDMVEITLMTILYSSIILISVDRSFCVILKIRYNHYITEKLVKTSLVITWVVGIFSGPIMWVSASHCEYGKIYYYLSFDIIVLIVAMITYLSYGKLIHNQNRKFQQTTEDTMHFKMIKQMFLVPSLIIICFILFNVIPDIIAIKYFNNTIHHVIACLWGLGYNADPIIYIFLNKKCRVIVLNLLRRSRKIIRSNRMDSVNNSIFRHCNIDSLRSITSTATNV